MEYEELYKDYFCFGSEKQIKAKKQRFNTKIKVLSHYSDGCIRCKRCGLRHVFALTIDHINNDGAEHRKRDNLYGGNSFYRWLIKNKYPEGFQVLCMSCQLIKQFETYQYYVHCPLPSKTSKVYFHKRSKLPTPRFKKGWTDKKTGKTKKGFWYVFVEGRKVALTSYGASNDEQDIEGAEQARNTFVEKHSRKPD